MNDQLKKESDKNSGERRKSKWNSLEIAKIVAAVLFPATGFLIARQFTSFDEDRAKREQIIRQDNVKKEGAEQQRQAFRRILWEQIGPKLNRIYCYFLYVGSWKENKRDDIIKMKRELDEVMFANRAFFTDDFFTNYKAFTDAAFNPYSGWPSDAQLRTVPIRPQDKGLQLAYFTCENNGDTIHRTYWSLVNSASVELFDLPTKKADPPPPPSDYEDLAKGSPCGGFKDAEGKLIQTKK